jgi:KDO2-lipid IV(A) lauroyltransferase
MALLAYPILLIIYLLSLLPLWILYRVADFAYFILYVVLKYRVYVTRKNLRNAFPDKSDEELHAIEKRFYRHLGDVLVETIKSFSISASSLKKRMKVLNPEFLEHYYNQGRSVIATTGHYGNWEWAAMTLSHHYDKFQAMGLYLPLKNKVFNRAMIRSRSRFGVNLVSVTEISEVMEKTKNDCCIWGLIVDQSPGRPEKAIWLNFLHQETPIAPGTEKYSRQYNMVVVYGKITKIKRGYYTLEYLPVIEQPTNSAVGQITAKHTSRLEEVIKSDPAYWLWTHKRWKHKRPAGVEMTQITSQA